MRRPQQNPTPDAIRAALAFQAVRMARTWRVFWPRVEPTLVRYQAPVCLAHVLGEHHTAIAAEPVIGD